MLCKHLLPALLCLGLAALFPRTAGAGVVNWTVTQSVVTSPVTSDQGRVSIKVSPAALPIQTSIDGDPKATPVYFNLQTLGTLPTGAHDTFTNKSFTLNVGITDKSGAAGSAAFVTVFGGSMSATNNGLTVGFTSPTTQHLFLGGFDYKLSVVDAANHFNFLAPGVVGTTTPGDVMVAVTITDDPNPSGSGGGPPDPGGAGGSPSTPEPSGFALAGLGVVCLGLVRRHRLKKAQAAAAV